MADKNGKFLFEVRPDIFPEGYLTPLETAVWALYFQEQEQKRKHG